MSYRIKLKISYRHTNNYNEIWNSIIFLITLLIFLIFYSFICKLEQKVRIWFGSGVLSYFVIYRQAYTNLEDPSSDDPPSSPPEDSPLPPAGAACWGGGGGGYAYGCGAGAENFQYNNPRTITATTPIAIIDFKFSSQNLFFNAPACFSNWALPSCNASALSSSSLSFESLSSLLLKMFPNYFCLKTFRY